MPPRRRSTGIRRPRVAGTQNRRPREALDAGASAVSVDVADPQDAVETAETAETTETAELETAELETAEEPAPGRSKPQGRRARRAEAAPPDTAPEPEKSPEPPKRARTAAQANAVERRVGRALVALAVIGVICAGLAVWFAIATGQLRGGAAAGNDALVDVAATSQVKGQVEDALKKVYSYDFTRLDENERTARTVITGDFATKFDALFKSVRELAPGQQAVVSATVAIAAVKVIDGDRAIVIVFLDQQATRGVDAKQLVAAGRLTVTAQRVDGQWKIADVDSR